MACLAEKLQDVFSGKTPGKYMYPLFWLREDSPEAWKQEIAVMKKANMGGFIVESRPYPDYPGEKWMQALELIISEAKRHDMKIFIFDDKHFPSGECAGLIRESHPEFRRKMLRMEIVEVMGPQKGCSLNLQGFLRFPDDRFFRITAFKVNSKGKAIENSQLDLTNLVQRNEHLYWQVPAGHWRICVFCTTIEGGEEHTRDYINMLDPAAVRFYIENVYEVHYKRFAAEFGKTIQGFFSDEPRFGNAPSYHATLGKISMVLPWDDRMLDLLTQAAGKDFSADLPFLFIDSAKDGSARARQFYMDTVSLRYSETFSCQIGKWCSEHNVEYISHSVEDNGAHARLGYGNGHFFRAQAGQSWAGIDTVLLQNVPGFTDGLFYNPFSEPYDCRFFHWGLGKLASSCAHLTPAMQGRAFCEIFGAYGWNEGLKMCKQLTDHFAVRGINRFLPHAFSPQEFPDRDCPPHFYARGFNPQWRFFANYSKYANNLCHLLSDGVHRAPVAVLYHAEAEWSGGAFDPFESVTQKLMQHDIDCDVVCFDMLEQATVRNGKLLINQEDFQFLVIPYSQILPAAVSAILKDLAEKGLKIFSVACEFTGTEKVKKLAELPAVLQKHGLEKSLTIFPDCKDLRCYHYQFADGDIFMLVNENLHKTLKFRLQIGSSQKVYTLLDLFNERCGSFINGSEMVLSPGESVIISSKSVKNNWKKYCTVPQKYTAVMSSDFWQISFAASESHPEFTPSQFDPLGNPDLPGRLAECAGTIRYQKELLWNSDTSENLLLDAGEAGEIVELWINDNYGGCVLHPPYLFDISNLLHKGSNTVKLEVTTTLGVKYNKDIFTRGITSEAAGLIGPVRIAVKSLYPELDK